MNRQALENLLPKNSSVTLDASDFAALDRLSLSVLNRLIAEVGHELYHAEPTVFAARRSVVSLFNLGLISLDNIYGAKQYA